MPDPVRTVRVPDELWTAVQDRAWRRREAVSDYLRLALRAYIANADAAESDLTKIVEQFA
jgi:hypothetical protein